MRVLVLGSGGREHAIAWACEQHGHTVTISPELGEVTADDVEAEHREHDNTSAGAEHAAGARAALPVAEEKERAWQLATEDPDVPNETHRKVCAGFWQYGQEFDYTDRYVTLLEDISAKRGSWGERGYAAIVAAVRWLFPAPRMTEELVDRFTAWLDSGDASQQVHRIVTERVDDARRALNAQRASSVFASPAPREDQHGSEADGG